MQNYSASPREMIGSFWRNRLLIYKLVYREVVGRYKGSMLGIFWSLVNPILMLAVYTFVFRVVFQARWQGGSDSIAEFSLLLFAGLMVFNLFSECVSRAPNLVLMNVNYVKKVIFPLEILPWVIMGGALFHFMASFIVWTATYVFFFGAPHWQSLLLPIILLPLVLFVMGLSWGLASIGVYLRDIGQIIGLVISILMFLTPIFYPATALPSKYQNIILFNPLTIPVDLLRDILYFGKVPNLFIFGLYCLSSIIFGILGFACFQKTRKGFADVV